MNRQGAFDVHHHFLPPTYLSMARRHAERDLPFSDMNSMVLSIKDDASVRRLDGRLEEMERNQLGGAALSVMQPGRLPADSAFSAELIATANDGLVEACQSAPGRFVALAGLPMPHVQASIAEIDRVSRMTVVRGLCLGVDGFAYQPELAVWTPVLAKIAEAGLPVLVHPSMVSPGDPPPTCEFGPAFDGFGLGTAIATVVATSLFALRMILSGRLDEVPSLTLIIPHCGGIMPYLAQRLYDQSRSRAEHDLEHYLRNRLYYDSCSFYAPAMRCHLETVGAARTMLGSDYPFRGDLARAVDSVLTADLGADEAQSILAGVARQVLGPLEPTRA